MKIKQVQTGDAEIVFTEKELEILNKHKKLTFAPESWRDFCNTMLYVIYQMNLKFDEEIKQKNTFFKSDNEDEVEIKSKNDTSS